MDERQFLSICWPLAFRVKCRDGSSVMLQRGDGVRYVPAADDPLGRGMICATMFARRSGQKSRKGQCVYLDEIESIESAGGGLVWGKR